MVAWATMGAILADADAHSGIALDGSSLPTRASDRWPG